MHNNPTDSHYNARGGGGGARAQAYRDLWDGVYYPAVSMYYGGRVTANFGPRFAFPPPADAGPTRPMSEAVAVVQAWEGAHPDGAPAPSPAPGGGGG